MLAGSRRQLTPKLGRKDLHLWLSYIITASFTLPLDQNDTILRPPDPIANSDSIIWSLRLSPSSLSASFLAIHRPVTVLSSFLSHLPSSDLRWTKSLQNQLIIGATCLPSSRCERRRPRRRQSRAKNQASGQAASEQPSSQARKRQQLSLTG